MRLFVCVLTTLGAAAQSSFPPGLRLIEQDIVVRTTVPPGDPQGIAPVAPATRLWPDGLIPYVIDLEVPQREVIAQAMRHWSDRTPIRFVPRTTEANYVRFQLGPTCAAHVGMQGGEQGVFLAADCPLSNTVHEIGHTIGLWHEQFRQDRDRHIVYRPEAIPPAAREQHVLHLADAADIGPYDYGSIMHYGPGVPGPLGSYLETKPPGIPVGLPDQITQADIDGVSRLYGVSMARTTIDTHPSGLGVIADGRTYTAPQRFEWAAGSVHTVEALEQTQVGATRYAFARWSDDGLRAHQIQAAPELTIYVANMRVLHRLQVQTTDAAQGTVSLETSDLDGWAADGSFATLTATPAAGFRFYRWNYPLAARQPPFANPLRRFVRDARGQAIPPYTAEFTRGPVTTVATEPEGLVVTVDGQTWVSPVNFLWEPGSAHTVSVQEAYLDIGDTVRRRFLAWSDGGARQHSLIAGPNGGALQARFATEYQVFVSHPVSEVDVIVESLDPGVVPPPREWFPAGARLRFRAVPKSQTRFAGWTGDLSVPAEQFERPLSLLVNMAAPGNLRTDGVRNAASYVPGDRVAPGEIVTLFGAGIGPELPCSLELDSSGKVATEVCGVRVLFDEMPAPVLYASDRQVSAIVPFGISGQGRVRLRLSFQGVAGEQRSLEVTETAPSLFTADSSGRGQGAILNQHGSLNSPHNPPRADPLWRSY